MSDEHQEEAAPPLKKYRVTFRAAGQLWFEVEAEDEEHAEELAEDKRWDSGQEATWEVEEVAEVQALEPLEE